MYIITGKREKESSKGVLQECSQGTSSANPGGLCPECRATGATLPGEVCVIYRS